MCENVVPAMNIPLSKSPSALGTAPLVTVCAAESSLLHTTSSPGLIVTIYGRKHSFVSSHPVIEDPCGKLTETCSANANGVIVIMNPVRIIEVNISF